MAPLQFFLANAFATAPHGGNQAAVVLLPAGDARASDAQWMAAVARDFGLPMTAFCAAVDAGAAEAEYAMRWFTPAGHESPLCGHATLATAGVLFARAPEITAVRFATRQRGVITATRASTPEAAGRYVEVGLSLPIAEAPRASADAAARFGPVFARAAGLKAEDFVQFAAIEGGEGVVAELAPTVDLAALHVDPAKLLPELAHHGVLTQIVGQGAGGVRINSRVFVPAVGIPEDPVTGSAHALLTQYYLEGAGSARVAQLTGTVNATADAQGVTLDAHQVSARGGAMKCTLVDGRAHVVGKVYQWAEGTLDAE